MFANATTLHGKNMLENAALEFPLPPAVHVDGRLLRLPSRERGAVGPFYEPGTAEERCEICGAFIRCAPWCPNNLEAGNGSAEWWARLILPEGQREGIRWACAVRIRPSRASILSPLGRTGPAGAHVLELACARRPARGAT